MTSDTSEINPTPSNDTMDADLRWLSIVSSSALLSMTCAAVVLGLGLLAAELRTPAYVWQNFTPQGSTAQATLLLTIFTGAAIGAVVLPLLQIMRQKDLDFAERSAWCVRKVLPLGPLALAPALFDWKSWQGHDEVFLSASLLNAVAFGAAVRAFLAVEPTEKFFPHLAERLTALRELPARVAKVPSTWLFLTVCASAAYVAWFGYHTAV